MAETTEKRFQKQLQGWKLKFDQLDVPMTAAEIRYAHEDEPATKTQKWVRFQGRIVWGFPRG